MKSLKQPRIKARFIPSGILDEISGISVKEFGKKIRMKSLNESSKKSITDRIFLGQNSRKKNLAGVPEKISEKIPKRKPSKDKSRDSFWEYRDEPLKESREEFLKGSLENYF